MRKPDNMVELQNTKSKASLILVPLFILLITLFGMLIPLGFPFEKIDGSAFRVALTTAYLFAAIVLIAMMVFYKVKKFGEVFDIYLSGMQRMMTVAAILVLAWSLGMVMKNLGTAAYVVELMDGNIPPYLIPAILFVSGACMSFATGTSWGTFAIMMPLAIPMAVHLDASIYICIGAVLSGGIFGDHCSPISDTTILSSTGAGTDHMDHVKTQIPYALLNGSAALAAYLIAGLTSSVISLGAAILIAVAAVIVISKWQKKRDFGYIKNKAV